MENKIKVEIAIALIIIAMIGIFVLEIVIPSFQSYYKVCIKIGYNDFGGKTIYNETTKNTTILIRDVNGIVYKVNAERLLKEENLSYSTKRILYHELCHKNQYENNRAYDCENPIGFYFNEVECYIKGNLLI